MQRVPVVHVLAAVVAVMLLAFLPGCGGGGNTANTTVTTIVLAPTSISLNQGTVATLSAVAQNSVGAVVAADITFTSSNTNIATVSSGGLVCGGKWDASIINCNATNGQAGVGQVTITATSNNVSATATVYVHERVDQVTAVVPNNCTSMAQAIFIQGFAYSTSAPGCSVAAPCNITSTVGPFNFGSNDITIAIPNTAFTGLTAGVPGATTVFAGVSAVNSVGVPYLTCPVATIRVHDASSSNTSFSLASGGTQSLTADVYDSNNRYIKPTLTWGSSSNAVATVAATGSANNPGTITAVSQGTASITASCNYPSCNKNVSAQYSGNVVTVNVSGSATTTVYAASTNSKMLVPFNIATDVPGTAISLPNYPNSIVVDPSGAAIYLGSSGGLMAVSVASGTVATAAVNGSIVAISPDGKFMLISDSVANNLYYFNLSTLAVDFTQPSTTVSSAVYTPDSQFNEWVSGTQLGVGIPTSLSGLFTLPYTANTLDISGQGGLTYITSSTGREVDVRSTCDQSELQMLAANGPTLMKALPNGTGAVAVDPPSIDVVSTPGSLSAGCPVTTQSTIASYDLGAGNFTPQQILVSTDSTRAWIVSDLPELLTFYLPTLTPSTIPLAGSATPVYAAATLDNAHVYIGASDGTVHRIDTGTASDVAQIAVSLKDANGNVTPPNLVTVAQ